ncbi:MAG TPA: hypothetical protein DEG17_13470 [Cyanobacteria bacterium UBA11149]|nr:hypothetical protein [Cyanobacteria bacterium UBA11367]HBE60188.1 hypothetical protein [Cyanobacteria bacterium UBA11366]HBK64068.1 hypothetical protein [Cyanobacteria bacterium UBA11166]HBR75561.1 hypothetical protein [Cyanobacteria bacterium UBA11159]HBS72408.1 hypothetical protein [Cyanobacteria bacterium UBA11153]HBW89851.1 hypothetical protein [Cyanobacteria bacterium UBA11149]HCA94433.1 hypothetical protein [Cyanobacteria bacterium UBA9226]
MSERYLSLPKGCRIKPADLEDKNELRKLLSEFIINQGFPLYFQQFIHIPILIFAALISIGIAWTFNIDSRIIISLAGLIILTIIYIIWHISIEPGLNWEKYWVIECNFRLVACGTIEKYDTYSLLNYLYIKSESSNHPETSAQSSDYWEKSAQRDYAKLIAQRDNSQSNKKRDRETSKEHSTNRKLAEYLVHYLIQQANPPIYLLCQPKMVEFYANIGFVRPSWSELPPQVAQKYSMFRNSTLGVLIQYPTNLNN